MATQSRVLLEWPEWQSEETAARYLDTSPNTLNAWRTRGKGPAFKRIGQSMVRYRKQDLDDWLKAQGRPGSTSRRTSNSIPSIPI